ncbi:TorD/DmsD family molecular chaperone [Adlercreutzia caecimuris]|uniref:TorD/DmsD family molecular chaperone n=1 Tax=Adlercreutzia caecimuris TaxID=671266 RepID=UPI00272D7978|nr:molecular chaperone TorD family protein [Adlercreutzia caecimuris]
MKELQNEALSVDALLLARSYLYALFGKVFSGEPDGTLVQTLSDTNTLDALEEYSSESVALGELRDYLRGLSAFVGDEAAIDRARSEFTRVLIGPATLPALCWGSPYESKDPALFQRGTLEVREAYERNGLVPSRILHVPDDHLALECNFMAEMGRRCITLFEAGQLDALTESIKVQKSFLDKHMLDWVPLYASGLERSGKAPFYSQLASGIAELVRLGSTFLGEVLFWFETGKSESSPGGLSQAMKSCAETLPEFRSAIEHVLELSPKFSEEYALVAIS